MSGNELNAPVVALAGDMIFAARIRGAAEAVGASVELARNGAALLARARSVLPTRILIDLDGRGYDAPALIRALKADETTASAEVVAFVSHVREDAIAAAREAGADRVLARGAFLRQLTDWVRPG